MQIHPDARRSVLVDLLTVYGAGGKCIVFANTKRDADEVSAAIANSMPTEVRHNSWCDVFSPSERLCLRSFSCQSDCKIDWSSQSPFRPMRVLGAFWAWISVFK